MAIEFSPSLIVLCLDVQVDVLPLYFGSHVNITEQVDGHTTLVTNEE